MEFEKVIEKRFSCRDFKEERITDEEIKKIINAGILAPTACNKQPQRIIVVNDEKILAELKEATRYTFNAKTIFVIAHDSMESWHRGNDGMDHGIVDSSIVATQMVLEMTNLGIGSCFVCSMYADKVKEILHLPESYVVDILLPAGYMKTEKPHNVRKSPDEIVSFR